MQVQILRKHYAEIMFIMGIKPKEVGGFGRARIMSDGFDIEEIYLPEQEISSSTTDITDSGTAKAMARLKIGFPGNENTILWWWHSHVDMTAHWSGTDNATITSLGSNGQVIATVLNLKGANRSAYYRKETPGIPTLFVDNISFVHSDSDIDTARINAEYAANVKEKIWGSMLGQDEDMFGEEYMCDKCGITVTYNYGKKEIEEFYCHSCHTFGEHYSMENKSDKGLLYPPQGVKQKYAPKKKKHNGKFTDAMVEHSELKSNFGYNGADI